MEMAQFVNNESNKGIYQPVFPELEPPILEKGVPPKRLTDQNGLSDQSFIDQVVPRNTQNDDQNTYLAEGGGSQGSLPPWRVSKKDFVGEQGNNKKPTLRIMPVSEDSEKAASDFYNSSTNWFKENGFEIGDVERIDINKKGEANREKYLLRTPVRDKNGNIVSYIMRRTGEAASNKTKKLLRLLR
ncbi:hypothetical protein AL01_05040 [Bombella intestini]|uniref:Uncharacterized protein n=2 Tax=Bombella intestini TaxID=1539051 RepID=A0A1S8GQU4_9PROT|nr:hypothetical protein AL01_05040 [Bombella intestini]